MDTLQWFATGIAAFVTYGCFYRWILQRNYRGPKNWPLLGCTIELGRNSSSRMHDWVLENCRKYYPTFKMKLPGYVYVVSVDPANVEHVLKTNFHGYERGEKQHLGLKDLLGDGILNVDGQAWKSQRKAASYEFASKVLEDYSFQTFKVDGLKLCNILDQAVNDNKPVDMADLFMRLTLESICGIGFGTHVGALEPSLPEIPFGAAFDSAATRCFGRFVDPFWKLKRSLGVGPEAALKKDMQVADDFIYKLVESRLAESNTTKQTRPDLLSRFVETIKDQSYTSTRTQHLRDLVTSFLFAGRDTTAVTLSWFFYQLSCNPQAEEKVVEELSQLADECDATEEYGEESTNLLEVLERRHPRCGKWLDFEKVNKMHYLHAALSESLRLNSSVPTIIREALRNDILPDGTRICKGEIFMCSLFSQGRMEQIWGSDVMEFKPERWLKNGVFQPESSFKFPQFSSGPRLCIGKHSAYLQMKIVAALLLRSFKFNLVPGQVVKYKPSITLLMDGRLLMTLQRR